MPEMLTTSTRTAQHVKHQACTKPLTLPFAGGPLSGPVGGRCQEASPSQGYLRLRACASFGIALHSVTGTGGLPRPVVAKYLGGMLGRWLVPTMAA